jgi:hypothetical protein
MTADRSRLPDKPATNSEVAAFLRQLAATPAARPAPGQRGRLLFALDATASRQPTWDRACHIQGEMFKETAALGGLDVQLAYYRGFGGFEASAWFGRAEDLLKKMTAVSCLGGKTQIGKVLKHAVAESKRQKISAVVFVGDHGRIDALCHKAGELGLLGVPVFIFRGADRQATRSASRA